MEPPDDPNIGDSQQSPPKDSQPTVGRSYEVDQGTKSLFKSWLPQRWLPREQNPDFHIDYRVEVVNDGEPSGLHFQAQLKGRSIHKRKSSKFSEPFETKHLLYYLRCEEPVFVFLIDPDTNQGYWLFIQQYLREHVRGKKLQEQETLTIRFDAQRSFDRFTLFDKDLHAAWKYMRDLHPGSPYAAVLAEQKRLQALDPRASVHIASTLQGIQYQVKFSQLKLDLGNALPDDKLKAFFEDGQEIKVRAADLGVDASPLLKELLRDAGDAPVTVQAALTLKGFLQFTFPSQQEFICIQVDGEWSFAAKKAVFTGQLADSPLRVELDRTADTDQPLGTIQLKFRFAFSAWEGQSLLGLSHFSNLLEFVRQREITVAACVQGNKPWPAENVRFADSGHERVGKAFEWLQKCRQAAKYLGMNPPFPKLEPVNVSEHESQDTRLMVKLIETGVHEQSIFGDSIAFEGDCPPEEIGRLNDAARITWTEPPRIMKFFGMDVRFGPLSHTWTNINLVEAHPLTEKRAAMTFKGAENSIWRIDYKRQT